MKHILILFLVFFSISCSSDSDNNDTIANNQEWKFKINGVQHQWTGDSNDPMSWGSSFFSQENNSVEIELTGLETDPMMVLTLRIPNLNQGSFQLDSSNEAWLLYSNLAITYYAESNDKLTLHITDSNDNLIIGTFSGRLRRENNQGDIVTINITEGYFKAIRQ
jgi:hypothetical protein